LSRNDSNGVPLEVFVTSAPFGTLWDTAPDFVYLPNPEHEGLDYFNCGYTDGTQTNYVSVLVTVRHFEDPPIALDRSLNFLEDGGGKFLVQASGWDFDPSLVDCQIVDGPTNGVLTRVPFEKMSLQYIPNTNFSGIDHFTYRCFDNDSTGNVASVRISV
jgi:hypothetical protein